MKGQIKAGLGALIGNAGEYAVMSELLKQGIIAGLVPRNAPAFDILATKGDQTARIRVKTKSDAFDAWQWVAKEDGEIFRLIGPDEVPGEASRDARSSRCFLREETRCNLSVRCGARLATS